MIKNSNSFYKKEIIVIPLLGLFFTLLLTWPLLLNINGYIPANGDGIVESWIAWYSQHAVLTGRIFNQTLFFNGSQFYPVPYTIAYSDNLFLLSLLFAPLYWLINNISLWMNVITLFTFIFTFCSSYYAISKFTGNRYASIVGAFIFTYNPITFAHYEPGHINLLSKYFIFLEFYFGFIYFLKPSLKSSLLFFLFFTLTSLSSVYYEIFSILMLPFFLLPFFLLPLFKKNYFYFKKLFISCISIIPFLPFLFYFNMPYLQFSNQEGIVRGLSESIYYSAQPIDFLASLPINFIYGSFVRSLDSSNPPKILGGSTFYYGHTLSFDIVPTVLACIGLVYLFCKRKKIQKSLFVGFSVVFIFSLLMMFGPYLTINQNIVLKLPYYYLYYYLPIPLLQSIRAPGRFEFFVYIPFSLLAAYGCLFLLKKSRINKIIIIGIILFLLVLENFNITNYSLRNSEWLILNSYNNNKKLHTLLDNKILLNYPNFDPNQNSEEANYLLWSIFFKARIMNGDTGYLPSDLFTFLDNLNLTDSNDLNKLKALGLQDIIIHNTLLNYVSLKSLLLANKNLITYKDKNITVLDISRINKNISYCSKKELHYSLETPKIIGNSQQMNYQIIVSNNNNCYLVNKYKRRYLSVQLLINGEKYSTYLQFPPVIAPHENAILNENFTSYDLKNIKVMNGSIFIKDLNKRFTF